MLRIKEILKEKGMSQKDLAERLGVAPVTFSLTINGNPTVGTLQKIADVLNVQISDLFDGSDDSYITCPHCGRRVSVKVGK